MMFKILMSQKETKIFDLFFIGEIAENILFHFR